MLGEDWAPNGFERWHADGGPWEVHAETAPTWPWTDGLPHFVDCIEEGKEPVLRPEHAYHALEVALAATTASNDGRTQPIQSSFPALDYGTVARKLPGARSTTTPETRSSCDRGGVDGDAHLVCDGQPRRGRARLSDDEQLECRGSIDECTLSSA